MSKMLYEVTFSSRGPAHFTYTLLRNWYRKSGPNVDLGNIKLRRNTIILRDASLLSPLELIVEKHIQGRRDKKYEVVIT